MIYSDLTAKDFNNPNILLGSLWYFDRMDKTNGHENNYHGQFVPQVAQQLIKRYTKPGDMVIDWFMGSGTSIIEAAALKRRAIGIDIKKDMWPYIIEKVSQLGINIEESADYSLVRADSSGKDTAERITDLMEGRAAQLCILHPPYHNIVKFTDMPEDLSNMPDVEIFLTYFFLVAMNAYDCLEPERFAALVIGDIYQNSEVVPLGFLCMQEMMSCGFIPKSIIVKNIAGNERGKGKNGNIWRYRALQGNFSIFEHEYIFIFQKPGAKKGSKSRRKTEDSQPARDNDCNSTGV